MDNFYVLYGQNKSEVQYECDKLVKKLKSQDIIKYDMEEIPIESVIDDARTVGMFSNQKIIILNNSYFLTANKTIPSQELLEDYLEHYNKDNYLIFLVYADKIDTRKKINKLLAKHTIIEIKTVEEKKKKKYVEKYLKDKNYQIEDSNYFLSKVGKDKNNIHNELDKLMMYKINDKKILKIDIDKVCMTVNEDEIFSLTDAIIAKDKKKSLDLLNVFLNKNYDEMQIIMLLASQFRFFFQVKRLMNKNKYESDIAKTLGANPYRVKFTIKKLYPYSEEIIKDIIKRIAKMDHDIKLGLIDKKLALELFIINI